jgi:uncharacterized protein YciI
VPYFCVHAYDHPYRLDERVKLRDGHRARLRTHDHPVTVHIGGPLTDATGAMMGSMLVIEAADMEQVKAYLAGDPYVMAGLYNEIRIDHFNWGLGLPVSANG